jgi:Zn-dependent protease with chaperone function
MAEAPVVALRILIVWVAAALILLVTGHSTLSASTWALIGLWPTLWSVSALIPSWGSGKNSQIALGSVLTVIVLTIATGHLLLALSTAILSLSVLASPWATGWWWRSRVGGREPSQREREAFRDAMQALEDRRSGELPRPRDWFVLDLPDPEAAVCGQTLMLTHALLESPYLTAVLAHELGHLSSLDGRMAAAINRLAIHPLREPHPDEERYKHQAQLLAGDDPVTQTILAVGLFALFARLVLKCARGGLGIWLLRPLWGQLWREGEYRADRYAASLSQGEDLAGFLDTNALLFDQPVPFAWLTAHTHPAVELRIDRLTTNDHDIDQSHSHTGFTSPTLQEQLPGLGAAGV